MFSIYNLTIEVSSPEQFYTYLYMPFLHLLPDSDKFKIFIRFVAVDRFTIKIGSSLVTHPKTKFSLLIVAEYANEFEVSIVLREIKGAFSALQGIDELIFGSFLFANDAIEVVLRGVFISLQHIPVLSI